MAWEDNSAEHICAQHHLFVQNLFVKRGYAESASQLFSGSNLIASIRFRLVQRFVGRVNQAVEAIVSESR